MEVKYVDAKGIRTRYLEAGSGEPLLLIHGGDFGWYSNANDWDLNIDGLTKHFHVFAIDKLGCGFTDNPKSDAEYVIGATVSHAYDFLKTMNIKAAHVAGHSRGGYTACRLAMEYPGLVKTLIIVSSSTLASNVPTLPVYAEWERLGANIKDVKDRQRYLVAANSYGNDHVNDRFVDIMTEVVVLPKTKEAKAKMAILKPRHDADLAVRQKEVHDWIREGRLRVPTLIIWGYNDPSALFDPIGISALKLMFPTTVDIEMHILNHAGHYCYREQPEAFNAAVIGFIKTHS